VIGYGLHEDPAGHPAALIRWANRQPAPVLPLDAPSGLAVTSGLAGDPCVEGLEGEVEVVD
jgi:NAD(P)H-hydrate repair Nnr-like enzyme with NAD(P)H-hydrate epimerase domain